MYNEYILLNIEKDIIRDNFAYYIVYSIIKKESFCIDKIFTVLSEDLNKAHNRIKNVIQNRIGALSTICDNNKEINHYTEMLVDVLDYFEKYLKNNNKNTEYYKILMRNARKVCKKHEKDPYNENYLKNIRKSAAKF